ncbi:MAG: proline--tRNA ligase [Candidatus Aenigmatarchaeota archaeon]
MTLENKKENLSEWYEEVIKKTQLADYSPVKGCIVYLPYGYAIWKNIMNEFSKYLDDVQEVYFPLFIPKRILEKEAEHFKGFKPEVAWVTKAGDSDLEEPLAVRPTSETIMYSYIAESELIKSWRDLPLKIIQWCNVVRMETKATKPFLRAREFLWHEGHTFHSSFEEAEEEARKRILQYKEFVEKYLAIPVIVGKKSEAEKFAGAHTTYTIETLMPDGRALQCGTSHNLSNNFSKVFGIYFTDKDEKRKLVYQTSWGFSTRLIGAIIMVHGDDLGLVLPPKVAPIQVIIIPIYYSEEEKEKVLEKCREIAEKLKKFRVKVDDREQYTPGYKFNNWELRGVPIRIEIGKSEIETKEITIFRRDTMKREKVKESELEKKIEELIEEIQKNLYEKAKEFLESRIKVAKTFEEFKKFIEEGYMVLADHCGKIECEEKIKEETKATSRVIELNNENPISGKCIYCNENAKYKAYFAKSY